MSLYTSNTIDKKSLLMNSRQMLTLPRHFVTINTSISIKLAKDWIWKNLSDRFYISHTVVGFENPAEATMFGLVADQFKIDDNF